MKEFRGIDIDKLVNGVRMAVINDLIKDLELLKVEIKILDKQALIEKLI